MAAVTTLLHEIKTVKTAHDNLERERDKLKSDLQVEEKMGKNHFYFVVERLQMSVPVPLRLRLMNNMLNRKI